MSGKKRGRPTIYTDAVAEKVYTLVGEGVPAHKIGMIAGMPKWTTLKEWQAARPEFAAKVARAREAYADRLVHEVVSIADECDPSMMCAIELAKLRTDVRRWAASAIAPHVYGLRQTVDLNAVVQVTQDEVDSRLDRALAAARARCAAGAPDGK